MIKLHCHFLFLTESWTTYIYFFIKRHSNGYETIVQSLIGPSNSPTASPSYYPTYFPSYIPTVAPSISPTAKPTSNGKAPKKKGSKDGKLSKDEKDSKAGKDDKKRTASRDFRGRDFRGPDDVEVAPEYLNALYDTETPTYYPSYFPTSYMPTNMPSENHPIVSKSDGSISSTFSSTVSGKARKENRSNGVSKSTKELKEAKDSNSYSETSKSAKKSQFMRDFSFPDDVEVTPEQIDFNQSELPTYIPSYAPTPTPSYLPTTSNTKFFSPSSLVPTRVGKSQKGRIGFDDGTNSKSTKTSGISGSHTSKASKTSGTSANDDVNTAVSKSAKGVPNSGSSMYGRGSTIREHTNTSFRAFHHGSVASIQAKNDKNDNEAKKESKSGKEPKESKQSKEPKSSKLVTSLSRSPSESPTASPSYYPTYYPSYIPTAMIPVAKPITTGDFRGRDFRGPDNVEVAPLKDHTITQLEASHHDAATSIQNKRTRKKQNHGSPKKAKNEKNDTKSGKEPKEPKTGKEPKGEIEAKNNTACRLVILNEDYQMKITSIILIHRTKRAKGTEGAERTQGAENLKTNSKPY